MRAPTGGPASRAPRGARAVAAALAAGALAALAAAGAPPRAEAAARDWRYALHDSLPDLAAPPDSAVLVLVREQFVRKNPLPPERITLDGAPHAWLPQRAFHVARVAPGLRRLGGLFGAPDLVLGCAPGRTLLLRLRETIDEEDRLRMRWILDDPAVAPELVRAAALPLAVPTARGVAEIAKRAARGASAAPPDTAGAPADTALTLSLAEIWFEHPLDPMNLRRDFSILTGELTLGGGRLAYLQRHRRGEVRVSIPLDSIESVRFGGTRYVGSAPWIDIVYREGAGRWRASFADASPANPEGTYNRIFGALALRRRSAAPRRPARGRRAAARRQSRGVLRLRTTPGSSTST
uniref:Uncharacterized protein n=1 Tax=Eiseniibacteriota bacterium TaxID=2212470 RepID=A0A832I3I5_UNCEI